MHLNHGARPRGRKGRLGRKSPRLQNSSKKRSSRPVGSLHACWKSLVSSKERMGLVHYELKADHRKPGLSMNTMVDPQGQNWSCQLNYAREDLSGPFSRPPQSALCITQSHLWEELFHGSHGSCLLRKILEKGGQQYELQFHCCN